MRICYVSTYPPIECGIATYTQYLAEAMLKCKKEILIISQFGAKGTKVFPAYDPNDYDISKKMFRMASKLTPDIIHIEHEYGLFGDARGIQIIDFLLRCKMANVPTATTLHTVFETPGAEEDVITENIVRNSTIIIVHEEFQKNILIKLYGHGNKISVFPHGVREIKKITRAKKMLDLEGKKIILLAGYFRPTKGFDKIVKIFPEIVKENKDSILLVAGKTRGLEYSDYQKYFFDLINNSPAKDKIHVLRGQFPQYTFDVIMSAADVIALPYETGAQSGIMAQASAFDIPVVTSDLESFKLWNNETKGGLTAHNDNDYVKHISKILSDDDFAKQLQNNIKKSNKLKYWHQIAKEHILLYEQVITVPYGKAKYFYVPSEM